MILFKPWHVPKIVAPVGDPKRKTQSRRNWKKCRVKKGSLHWAQTKLFDPSSRFAKLLITHDCRHEPLGAISRADAKAEGGYTPKQFLGMYVFITGPTRLETEVHCIEWEVAEVIPGWQRLAECEDHEILGCEVCFFGAKTWKVG